MVEGGGFEPPYPKGPDLQSGAFNRSAIPPQRLGRTPSKRTRVIVQLRLPVNGVLLSMLTRFWIPCFVPRDKATACVPNCAKLSIPKT